MTPKRALCITLSLAAALFAAHLTFAPEADAARLGGGPNYCGLSKGRVFSALSGLRGLLCQSNWPSRAGGWFRHGERLFTAAGKCCIQQE